MFLHFVVFGKQVSLEAPEDKPLRETIVKAFEFHKVPISGDYKVRFEADQNEQATPSELGIKEGTIVHVVEPDA